LGGGHEVNQNPNTKHRPVERKGGGSLPEKEGGEKPSLQKTIFSGPMALEQGARKKKTLFLGTEKPEEKKGNPSLGSGFRKKGIHDRYVRKEKYNPKGKKAVDFFWEKTYPGGRFM